jgi:hypothetical protein
MSVVRSSSPFARRAVLGVGLAALMLVFGVAAGPAVAVDTPTPGGAVTTQDTASTKAYIALQERYDIVTIRRAPAVNAAEAAVVAQARSGCSNVLKDAPKKLHADQVGPMIHFFTEALLALNIDQLAPLAGLSDRVGDQQQRLRFSDPALQWQVDVDGSALLAYLALRPPDLCAGARVLAASHYTKMTAAGTRFEQDASALFPLAAAAPTSLVRQMRPYAPDAVSVALKRLPELQRTLDHKLAFGRHYEALVRALGETREVLTHDVLRSAALAGAAS